MGARNLCLDDRRLGAIIRRVASLLREEHDLGVALDKSLALEAMGIANEVESIPQGRWTIVVDDADAAAAEGVLAAWEGENAPRTEPPGKPTYGPSAVGAVASLAIVSFAAFVGLSAGTNWVERGTADAARVLHGEWWRVATALTLHADAGHVAGNAVAIGVLITALARRLGPALAVWLALVAGLGGNAATALVARSGHLSIGASTAVFGALGSLSALQVPGRRAWLTLGAGVALLGLLGTGERADLLAHLFGFVAGVMEGLALRRLPPPRRSPLQPAVAAAAVASLVAAWWCALTAAAVR
jgi:rhomboid protease GluP